MTLEEATQRTRKTTETGGISFLNHSSQEAALVQRCAHHQPLLTALHLQAPIYLSRRTYFQWDLLTELHLINLVCKLIKVSHVAVITTICEATQQGPILTVLATTTMAATLLKLFPLAGTTKSLLTWTLMRPRLSKTY